MECEMNEWKCAFYLFFNIFPSTRSLPTESFFTDIYGLKFCVQFLHYDLQSSGMLRSMDC